MDKLLDMINDDVYEDYMRSKYGYGLYGTMQMASGETSQMGMNYLPIDMSSMPIDDSLLELDEQMDKDDLLYEEYEMIRRQTLEMVNNRIEKIYN
jgi:hypothetical protein